MGNDSTLAGTAAHSGVRESLVAFGLNVTGAHTRWPGDGHVPAAYAGIVGFGGAVAGVRIPRGRRRQLFPFGFAKKSLDCAIAIQHAFAEHNAADGEHVKVRIGLHAGEAIKDGDDFYGKNVILASRVAERP
jgi:class 3 adenylate cyclase